MKKKQTIIINSKDRLANSISGSNSTFHLNDPDLHEVKKIQLKEISVTNLIYNIDLSNNVFSYNDNGTDYTVNIPIGYYNITTLLDALNASQAHLVFSINGNGYVYNITSINPSYVSVNGTINKIIGFTIVQPPGTLYSGNKPIDLIRTNYINVLSNIADSDSAMTSDNQRLNLICSLPVNLPFGYILQRSEELDSADYSTHTTSVNIADINVRLVDDNFQELELNGGDYVMHFNIYK